MSRAWISTANELPPLGERVEVWMLEDRTAEDGPVVGKWCGAFGYRLNDRWLVDGDLHAIVSHWRPATEGPTS